MLQRRSANRFSGFASYAYLFTTLTDRPTGLRFPADGDQRHAARAAAHYRLGANWNLSSVWRYGSGQPLTGFLVRRGPAYFLASQRNTERLPADSRLDVRLSKASICRIAVISRSRASRALNQMDALRTPPVSSWDVL